MGWEKRVIEVTNSKPANKLANKLTVDTDLLPNVQIYLTAHVRESWDAHVQISAGYIWDIGFGSFLLIKFVMACGAHELINSREKCRFMSSSTSVGITKWNFW